MQDRPYTIFFDGTFDWGDVIQATHRNYRVGQEVDCKYLSLEGDVNLEGLMRNNNEKKSNMANYFRRVMQ